MSNNIELGETTTQQGQASGGTCNKGRGFRERVEGKCRCHGNSKRAKKDNG